MLGIRILKFSKEKTREKIIIMGLGTSFLKCFFVKLLVKLWLLNFGYLYMEQKLKIN